MRVKQSCTSGFDTGQDSSLGEPKQRSKMNARRAGRGEDNCNVSEA